MANEAIGHCKCPWCGSKRMRVSLDKKGKVGVVCSACHFQGFARGALSDMAIRQAMVPVERLPAPPEPAPGMAIEAPGALDAGGGVPKDAAPAPAPAKAAPAPAPEKKRNDWDLY